MVLYSILLWDAFCTHTWENTHTLPPSLTHPQSWETLINCTRTNNKIILLLTTGIQNERFCLKSDSDAVSHVYLNHLVLTWWFYYLVCVLMLVVDYCYLLLLQTTNAEKVLLKSSPILFVSYYLMFAYCLNGQQLTEKVNNKLSIFNLISRISRN